MPDLAYAVVRFPYRAVVLPVPPASEVGVAGARQVGVDFGVAVMRTREPSLREQVHTAAFPQPRSGLQLEVVLGDRQRFRLTAAGVRAK